MEKKENVNLKRLSSVLKKNSIKIVIVLFIFAICGYFYSYNMVTPKYKSVSTMVLASNNLNQEGNTVTQTELNLNKSLISTYGKILKSKNVLGQVIKNLNLDVTEEELDKNVQIEKVDDTQIIKIGVINESAIEAQEILRELNKAFIEEVKQIFKMDNINIVDEASFEITPYNINHARDIIGFLVIGSVFSVCMIACIYFFDTTIKIEQDIEEFTDVNVIGTVPKYKNKDAEELIVQSNSKSVISEALKTIRTNISFTKTNGNSRAILFTSCNSGEGKSWIASNMAVAYAQSNKNVIIVDADMRKGRQHNIFKVKNIKGLSNCLSEIQGKDDYETLKNYIQETQIPKVHIITIGAIPPNPSELLLSSKMRDLIYMLKCIYDIVIIDGTPCNLVSDSIPVSQIADTTILVTESRKTKIEDLKNVIKSIKNANGNIEGVILNKKDIKNKEYTKGYYYGEKTANNKIELKSYSVEELIQNRKDNIEVIENKEIIENKSSEEIENLGKKIESLEEKLLKLPDINLENYTKLVDEMRNIYNSELDKNKLAEDIKENIIRNELLKKLNETNAETKNVIEEKLQELNYENEIKGLINKVNNIEDAIEDNESEERIIEMIQDIKEEQNAKIASLDSKKFLSQILEKIDSLDNKDEFNKLSEQISSLDSTDSFNKLSEQISGLDSTDSFNKLSEQISGLDSTDSFNKLSEQISGLDNKDSFNKLSEQISGLDNKDSFNKLSEQISDLDTTASIKKLSEKVDSLDNREAIKGLSERINSLDNKEAINKILEKLDIQNKKIENLDASKILNNIVMEMQKLNGKYEKVNNIELAIQNDKSEENISNMINQLRQEQNTKLEKLENTDDLNKILATIENQNKKIDSLDASIVLNNIVLEIQKLNNKYDKVNTIEKMIENDRTEESIAEMIYELKQEQSKQIEELNSKYEKLAERIVKENSKTQKEKISKTSTVHKNNVIEMSEIKEKLNKKELFIEYGDEIDYEDLVDLAVKVYDLKSNESQAI